MSKWGFKKIFQLTFLLNKDKNFSETLENMMTANSWLLVSTHNNKNNAFCSFRNISFGQGEHVRLLNTLNLVIEREGKQIETLDAFIDVYNSPDESSD